MSTALGEPFMDSDDIAVLTSLSHNILMLIRMGSVQLTLFGAYFVLCAAALYTIISRPQKSRRTYFLLGALIVTFIFVTLGCMLNIAILVVKVQTILIDNPELPFMERVASYKELSWRLPVDHLQTVLTGTADSGILFAITDILTSWRAISIWQSVSDRFMPLVLYFLLFCGFALDITYSVMYSLDWVAASNSDPLSIVAITGSTTSIVANLIATGMIAYIARSHQRLESESGVKLSGARILALLTESGLIYATIQIVRLALALSITPSTPPNGSLMTAVSIFEEASYILSVSPRLWPPFPLHGIALSMGFFLSFYWHPWAMYAPALILIINHGYSIADTVHLDTVSQNGSNPGQDPEISMKSLQFADRAGLEHGSFQLSSVSSG